MVQFCSLQLKLQLVSGCLGRALLTLPILLAPSCARAHSIPRVHSTRHSPWEWGQGEVEMPIRADWVVLSQVSGCLYSSWKLGLAVSCVCLHVAVMLQLGCVQCPQGCACLLCRICLHLEFRCQPLVPPSLTSLSLQPGAITAVTFAGDALHRHSCEMPCKGWPLAHGQGGTRVPGAGAGPFSRPYRVRGWCSCWPGSLQEGAHRGSQHSC